MADDVGQDGDRPALVNEQIHEILPPRHVHGRKLQLTPAKAGIGSAMLAFSVWIIRRMFRRDRAAIGESSAQTMQVQRHGRFAEQGPISSWPATPLEMYTPKYMIGRIRILSSFEH
jgi:hypothetical protein